MTEDPRIPTIYKPLFQIFHSKSQVDDYLPPVATFPSALQRPHTLEMPLHLAKGYFRSMQSRLSEWRRPEACLGTMVLPPEIIDMILEHLPPESSVAFALTCRHFYRQYMPVPLHLQPHTKESLLIFLERDLSGMYFYHRCCKLHSWNRYPVLVKDPWDHRYSDTCNQPTGWVPAVGYHFDYSTARLIMNRHFYGSPHGPRLEDVEESQIFKSVRFPNTTMRTSWCPRIIENELVLRGTIIAYTERDDTTKLRQFADNDMWDILCSHISHTDYPELRRDRASGTLFSSAGGPVRSCPQCYTDYQVDIAFDRWRGWVILVTKWMQLGSCRSPEDPKWRSLVGYASPSEHRILSCQAGRIRSRWESPGDSDQNRDITGRFLPLRYTWGIPSGDELSLS